MEACAKLLLEKEKISRNEFEALFDNTSVGNIDGLDSEVFPAGI